jgi:hypothetical protein
LPINKATGRAAVYMGKSLSSILRTRRKHKKRNAIIPTQYLKLPGQKSINVHVTLCLWMTLITVLSEIQLRISVFRVLIIPKVVSIIKEKNTFSVGLYIIREGCKVWRINGGNAG